MNTHSGRIERWLGADQAEAFSRSMRGWYGPPIPIGGMPGNIKVHGDGDFSGRILGGFEASAYCYLQDFARRLRSVKPQFGTLQMAGFATLTALLAARDGGHRQTLTINKTLANTGAAGRFSSSWYTAGTPAAGAVAAAAPGGAAPTSATAGAAPFTNALSGERSFATGGQLTGSSAAPVLLYDRIFNVLKTASSTTTEAVTGVPTRYQSTTATNADYAGGNFVFVESGTGINGGATAHNYTVCQYTDQSGNTGATMPSFVSANTNTNAGALDMGVWQWFAPLADGDSGIKALTQMQSDGSNTGSAVFVIGHPLGWLPHYIAAIPTLTDGVRSAFNLARVFDDACLSWLCASNAAPSVYGSSEILQG